MRAGSHDARMRRVLVAPFLVLLSLSATAVAQRPTSFACKRVLAADGRSWLEDHVFEAMLGQVYQLRPRREGETVDLDFGDAWVVPGLIDLHTHLWLRPYNEMSWDDQVRTESEALRSMRAVVHAETTKVRGVFAVRDLGTEGAGVADVALRQLIEKGTVKGPRLFCATRAIVRRGFYGPEPDDPNVPKGAETVEGEDEIRAAVRSQAKAGAQWIKVYADYRKGKQGPAVPTFSAKELAVLVAEASKFGLPVAAHATTDEGIRNAVVAGVRTIEHGSGASDVTLALMKERSVVLVPCLAANEAIVRYAGHPSPIAERLNAAKAGFQRAVAAGVEIGCGSDAGVFAHGENVRELELMVEYGMPADAVLRSATVVAAEVLGADGYGTVLGIGGFLVLRDDPWTQIETLRTPIAIYHGDTCLWGRRL